MQNTPSFAADQLLYLALATPYCLLVGIFLCGVGTGLRLYGRWLKVQSLARRLRLGLFHLCPVLCIGLIYLVNCYHAPDILAVLLALVAMLGTVSQVCVLGIAGCIYGLALAQSGWAFFKAAPWWIRVLLVTVPLDLLWSWVQQW